MDVSECIGSPFEILGDPPEGEDSPMYSRAFRVDDEGRATLIEIAQQHGKCGTCSGSMVSERYALVVRGFRAEVNGIVTNLSSTVDGVLVPATISLLNASRSNGASVICGVEQVQSTPAPASSPTASKASGSATPFKNFLRALGVLMFAPVVLIL